MKAEALFNQTFVTVKNYPGPLFIVPAILAGEIRARRTQFNEWWRNNSSRKSELASGRAFSAKLAG